MPGGKALQNRGKKQNMSLDDEEGEIMWKPLYYTILYYIILCYVLLYYIITCVLILYYVLLYDIKTCYIICIFKVIFVRIYTLYKDIVSIILFTGTPQSPRIGGFGGNIYTPWCDGTRHHKNRNLFGGGFCKASGQNACRTHETDRNVLNILTYVCIYIYDIIYYVYYMLFFSHDVFYICVCAHVL
jgi:hypothetical protein